MPRIVDIMAEELKWSRSEKAKQMEDAMTFLKTQMGKDANRAAKESIPITLTQNEVAEYVKRFNSLDKERKGFVVLNDIRTILRVSWRIFL